MADRKNGLTYAQAGVRRFYYFAYAPRHGDRLTLQAIALYALLGISCIIAGTVLGSISAYRGCGPGFVDPLYNQRAQKNRDNGCYSRKESAPIAVRH